MSDEASKPPKKMTVVLPADLHRALTNLKLDTGKTVGELLVEGAILIAEGRAHNIGQVKVTTQTVNLAQGKVSDWRMVVPSQLREWLLLIERALGVRDPLWTVVLTSIKNNLKSVAEHADREREQGDSDSSGEGIQGSSGASGAGKKSGSTTGRSGKKAG